MGRYRQVGKKKTARAPRAAVQGGGLCTAHAVHVAELEELYAQVPEVNCAGLCQAACGPIGMGDAEAARIRQAGGPEILRADLAPLSLRPESVSCPALTMLGRCSIYDLRPMICRIWAAVASMACPNGCRPAGGWLSEVDGQVLMLKAMRAGAPPRERRRIDKLIALVRSNPAVSKAMATWVVSQGHSGLPQAVQADILARVEQTIVAAAGAAGR